MSREQVEQRASLAELLLKAGWQLTNAEAFEHDLWLNPELTGRKRVAACIIELNFSVEDAYVHFRAANFQEGRAEYVIYFDSSDQAAQTVQLLIEAADHLTVAGAAQLSQKMAAAYPSQVFFFTGSTKIELTEANALAVFAQFNDAAGSHETTLSHEGAAVPSPQTRKLV